MQRDHRFVKLVGGVYARPAQEIVAHLQQRLA